MWAGDTIKCIPCCYYNMFKEIEKAFKEWELRLSVNKPAYIKKIKMIFDFVDIEKQDNDTLYTGVVSIWLETDSEYTVVDWMADADSYKNEQEEKETKEIMVKWLNKCLIDELEEGRPEEFWRKINLDNYIWKKKEEL